MNSFEIWRYAAYGMLVLIAVGCLVLIIGMYLDTKRKAARGEISAPDLGLTRKSKEAIFGENANSITPKSRKELRKDKKAATIAIDNVDSSKFFDDSDEAFNLSHGKD